MILLAMILFLIAGQKYIQPVFTSRLRASVVFLSLLAALLFQWYTLNYLPVVDCLPMKKGNNIAEQIKPPKNAVPSVYETRLIYQNTKTNQLKDMSQAEFNNSKIWEDSSWKWKETKTKLLRQGTDIPKLQNFTLSTSDGNDSTQAILADTGYVILYFVNPENNAKQIDSNFLRTANAKGVRVLFVTTDRSALSNYQNYPVLTCDGTVFRIAARVNPTIYLLKQATIINKWPLAKVREAEKTIIALKK
jgi:hypothetical protein